jgi:hypothetical protein
VLHVAADLTRNRYAFVTSHFVERGSETTARLCILYLDEGKCATKAERGNSQALVSTISNEICFWPASFSFCSTLVSLFGKLRASGFLEMEGYLSKKGKRMGSRVKRYMKLDGETLSNHHSPEEPSTWQVSIKDATVTSNPRRKKLVLDLYNTKMELYTDTQRECEQWVVALTKSRKAAMGSSSTLSPTSPVAVADTARSMRDGTEEDTTSGAKKGVDAGAELAPMDKKRVHDQLNKSFKVVKPAVRVVESESDSDGEYDDGSGASSGGSASGDNAKGDEKASRQPSRKNRVYEETPNSMVRHIRIRSTNGYLVTELGRKQLILTIATISLRLPSLNSNDTPDLQAICL